MSAPVTAADGDEQERLAELLAGVVERLAQTDPDGIRPEHRGAMLRRIAMENA